MRIKKTSETTPIAASVVNQQNNSTTDAYSCDYSNKAFGGTILWTNSSPTSSMGNNTEINLSSSDYDVYEIIYKSNKNDSNYLSQKSIKGNGILLLALDGGAQKNTYYRNINYTNAAKLTTGNCNNPGVGAVNDYAIPIYVIGYKTGLL